MPLMCTDYLHAYLIPVDMLCSQTMCELFLCAFTIVINSKKGGALKAEVLSLKHWVEYQSNARYNNIENDYGTI